MGLEGSLGDGYSIWHVTLVGRLENDARYDTYGHLDLILGLYFKYVFSPSLLPVSDEAGGTDARQLSVRAVASVEAGVVARVVAAHGNRQLRPPVRRQPDT